MVANTLYFLDFYKIGSNQAVKWNNKYFFDN